MEYESYFFSTKLICVHLCKRNVRLAQLRLVVRIITEDHNTCIHVYMYTCIHVYMYTCIHVYMYYVLYCTHVFVVKGKSKDLS